MKELASILLILVGLCMASFVWAADDPLTCE